MYTVIIERKIGDTQFVTFTGLKAAQKMVDRAKQSSNVTSAVIRDDAPAITVYGKWIAISNPSYSDGCELLTADEFAEQSEHITLQYSPVHDVVVGFETHTGDNATQFTGV